MRQSPQHCENPLLDHPVASEHWSRERYHPDSALHIGQMAELADYADPLSQLARLSVFETRQLWRSVVSAGMINPILCASLTLYNVTNPSLQHPAVGRPTCANHTTHATAYEFDADDGTAVHTTAIYYVNLIPVYTEAQAPIWSCDTTARLNRRSNIKSQRCQ